MKFLSFLTLFVLLMQPFTYGFYKALCWQFEGRLKKRGRRLLCLALFAFGNGLIILSLFRLWHGSFRLTALWMVLLLYTGFAALFAWLLKLLLRQRVADETLRRILRIAAPAAVASLFCVLPHRRRWLHCSACRSTTPISRPSATTAWYWTNLWPIRCASA